MPDLVTQLKNYCGWQQARGKNLECGEGETCLFHEAATTIERLTADLEGKVDRSADVIEGLLAYRGVSRSAMSERRRIAWQYLASRGRCVCRWAGRKRNACPIHPNPPFGEATP